MRTGRSADVRYYNDRANQLMSTTIEGVTRNYSYDLAGNLLSDGESSYTYNLQNQLVSKTNATGTTTYRRWIWANKSLFT